jgi:hypothetical protein
MNIKPLNELELTKILKIAQDGETKLKQMSDRATIMAEKWRVKTLKLKKNVQNREAG